MERIVLLAEYRTSNIFNEGFICISKEGKKETIEGIFTTDYMKFNFSEDGTLRMILFEPRYISILNITLPAKMVSQYECKGLYDNQISSPEYYHFKCKQKSLELKTLKREFSKEKIERVFNLLEEVRL